MAAFTFTRDPGTIGKQIDSIAQRSGKLTRDIQIVAISAIVHNIEHGNCTLAGNLYNAVTRAGNRASLAAFFQKHGAIIATTKNNKDGEAIADFKVNTEERNKLKDTDLDLLAETLKSQPWQNVKKETAFDGFVFKAELVKLIKRAEQIQKDDTRKGHAKNDFTGLVEARNMTGHVAAA